MFIKSLELKNFRSLKDVHIPDMRPVCVFHGLNNSGKSNILAALGLILQSKSVSDAPLVEVGTEQKVTRKRTSFHVGRLDAFEDNFYMNQPDPIEFKLRVEFDSDELQTHKEIIESIKPQGKGATQLRPLRMNDGHAKILVITGAFTFVDDQSCDVSTKQVSLNDNYILYLQGTDGKAEYVPSLHDSKKVDLDARVGMFEDLMRKLTDSFQVIGTDRFLGKETLVLNEDACQLAPQTFKQFLFSLSTHKTKHKQFKDICDRFGKEPFKFGEVSFFVDRKTNEIELMIERSHLRLPLGRLGSGLQQILFLIGTVLTNQKKIIAIEEIELNLSQQAQSEIFEMLKAMVHKAKLVHQVIVTSHSPYFQGRDDVKYYEVRYDHAELKTEVRAASKSRLRQYFKFHSGE